MINLPPPVHGLCAGYNCTDSHGPFSAVLGVSVSSLRHAHRSCTSVAQIRFPLNPNHVHSHLASSLLPFFFPLAPFLLPSCSHLYLDAHVLHKLSKLLKLPYSPLFLVSFSFPKPHLVSIVVSVSPRLFLPGSFLFARLPVLIHVAVEVSGTWLCRIVQTVSRACVSREI